MVKKDVKIYGSPFIRAVETVKPLADKLKIDIIQSDELKEIKIGKSEKLTKHEIINEMWKDKEFKVDNGESQIEKFKSMEYFLNKMFDNSSNEDVIIVTHGNLLGIILKVLF